MNALVDGLIAGYGVAVPIGAVSVLIVNLAIEKGFRPGFIAGAGTAFVDFCCAVISVFAGAAVVGILLPYETPLKWASGGVLIAMGVYGVLSLRRKAKTEEAAPKDGKVFLQFVAITILNPFTVVYFLALIMGNGGVFSYTLTDCILFVAGVTLASLSWQTFLAIIGAGARKHLSKRFMIASVVIGNLLVVALGINVLL
ncbi:MAG: LysE type translocator [Methanomassiliicoccales archaeon PtaU1.Bin124]|nr:MAG: LysE type translocator [Methanomassiliicoccales archaeon PtaU1.Bin124]